MTNPEIRNLKPSVLWNKFADLNAVPRPSKQEGRIIRFMKQFGESLNLETIVDETGNVIIRKPATKGMEGRKSVVLQSHLDMVHQKNRNTDFDFETQGIEMMIDGDWVKAKGTTLGADNGLGVATIMAILESSSIAHPALEALFTVDEETGMTGAMGLKSGVLKGGILLNLDTEEDDEIGVGCAGGVDVTAERTYEEKPVAANKEAFTITVRGLQGGHSGMDIHRGLGNANKIMNRFLLDGFENYGLQIAKLDGGGLRNAIPRESNATLVVDKIMKEGFLLDSQDLIALIKTEYKSLEPKLEIRIEPAKVPTKVMDPKVQSALTKAVQAVYNGVYRMSQDMEDLVEASNNLARVNVDQGNIKINCLTRSAVASSRTDLANTVRSAFELMGCTINLSGEYPGWKPNLESSILKVLIDQYKKLNDKAPRVTAGHGGLECGILGQHYPQMDMVSFGPTIKGAHSPDERASISSVQKFWDFTLEILKHIPEKH